MGSAFPSDPYGSSETVLFLTGDTEADPLVAHLTHRECAVESPHRMSTCGRFELTAAAQFRRLHAAFRVFAIALAQSLGAVWAVEWLAARRD